MIESEMWWSEPRNNAHDSILKTVRRIETNQGDIFERFHKLEVLYDPNTPLVSDVSQGGERHGGVHENVIASCVDTVSAVMSTTDVRARVMTDGADWEQQRTARRLELYAEEVGKRFDLMKACRGSFKEGALKGNGLVKVTQRFGAPVIQQVFVENVVVDQNETRDGKSPRQIHEWVSVDADELIAEFPKFAAQILAARMQRQSWRIDSRFIPLFDNQVVYLDSYRLPIGIEGQKGYKPGRHVKSITGATLLDEKWEKSYFPYSVFVWTQRAKSWYGIGGAERIAGLQRALNRRNLQIEQQLNRAALPTTYIRPADANLQVKTSAIGAMAVCKGDYPQTVVATAVSGETYKSREDLKAAALAEFGLSAMATHGTKPGGLDSGVALREFKDQTTDRFSTQEKNYEEFVLQTVWLLLDVCKDLGAEAPTVVRQGRFGSRKMKWGDVDLGDVRVQLYAASNLPRTPAGRMQFVIELAQAGVISQDSSRRLLQHPDLESELSLYGASLESVERCLDEMAEGNIVMPEPFQNLKMCSFRGQQEYLKWESDGAPEDKLELLRQFVVTAAWMASGGADAANANAGAQPMAPGMPVDPSMQQPMPGGMPPLAQGNPTNAPAVAAFAPQAMQLLAGTG